MTDLETRMRSALHDEPGWRSSGAVLDGVRRGARRRRGTRRVAAGAVVAVTLAGAAFAWPRQAPAPAPSFASHLGASGVATVAISVDASGTAYKVTGNRGCHNPCSTVSRSNAAGGWTDLASIAGSPDSPTYGPVRSLEMSPNGQDGWAWGTHLWSTHDGGANWSEVPAGPDDVDSTGENLDVSPGPSVTWADVTVGNGSQLWRTPTGEDHWTRVRLPQEAEQNIAAVLPDSRVAVTAVRHAGLNQTYYVGDGAGPWQRMSVSCLSATAPFRDREHRVYLCGPGGHRLGAGEDSGPATTTGAPAYDVLDFPVGVTDAGQGDPLGHVNWVTVNHDQAYLVTPQGAVAVDGPRVPLGDDAGVEVASSGSHVAVLDYDGHVSVSDDSGHHWRELN